MFRQCLNSVLNVKVLLGAFNQEKALEGVFFSLIVKTDGSFYSTIPDTPPLIVQSMFPVTFSDIPPLTGHE